MGANRSVWTMNEGGRNGAVAGDHSGEDDVMVTEGDGKYGDGSWGGEFSSELGGGGVGTDGENGGQGCVGEIGELGGRWEGCRFGWEEVAEIGAGVWVSEGAGEGGGGGGHTVCVGEQGAW